MDAVDTRANDPRWADFNRGLSQLAAGFGGRPLLNQTKQLTRSVVRDALGADWRRFVAAREREDPDGGRFLNDYYGALI